MTPTLLQRNDWLAQAAIGEIQAKLEAGELTSRELVLMYLERIAVYDQDGVKINSILEINPDALFIAEALDRERLLKGSRGPLHGIPIVLKDNIDTGDKMHTSAGSVALADHYAEADSFVAARLREAGAVLLGKANMTEWANLMSPTMPAGYSSRGGQVLNPYGPGTCFIGGSSSGSAAAVACGFAAGGIGTETTGSILSPAGQNSVVGIKPTVGLISRSGVIPVSYSMDTPGPMAKTVRDAALLLGAMTGVDEHDPATWSSEGAFKRDYTPYLREDGLQGMRIGVPREPFFNELNAEEKELMEAALETLRQGGATVIDNVVIPSANGPWNHYVTFFELRSSLNHYLGKLPAHAAVHSLEDVIRFNRDHADVALRYGQSIFTDAVTYTSGTLRDAAYLKSKLHDVRESRTNGIDYALQEHQLDALFFPGASGAALAARAGYPSVTVPAGYTPEGHPVGATFTGKAYGEPILLQIAYAYEQASQLRVPPACLGGH